MRLPLERVSRADLPTRSLASNFDDIRGAAARALKKGPKLTLRAIIQSFVTDRVPVPRPVDPTRADSCRLLPLTLPRAEF